MTRQWRGQDLASGTHWSPVPVLNVEWWKNKVKLEPSRYKLRWRDDDSGGFWQNWVPSCETTPWRGRSRQDTGTEYTAWRNIGPNDLPGCKHWVEIEPHLHQVQSFSNGVWVDYEPSAPLSWQARIAGGPWQPVAPGMLPVWQAAAAAKPGEFTLRQPNTTITKAQLFEAALQADLVYPDDEGSEGFYCNQAQHNDVTHMLDKMAEWLGVVK